MPSLRLYDAHNHLQDERFAGQQPDLIQACRATGVVRQVVNGSCEEDWPQVLELARHYPEVLPSFGVHPWYVPERSAAWESRLITHLETVPSAVGEIGLDRWKANLPYPDQEAVFLRQLAVAAERNLPASIHCLEAWGRLYDLLRVHPRPACGFLLHSYGGPREMIEPLARLGAYFGLPGYFAHPRKERHRQAFLAVPLDRLLVETDAPDQCLPAERELHPLPRRPPVAVASSSGTPRRLNHPANLVAVYAFAAQLHGLPLATLAGQIETNFQRLFGRFSAFPDAAFPGPGL